MFLDRELRDIEIAKAAVSKRCAMRRLSLQLDILVVRARVRGTVSGMKAILTVAGLLAGIFSSRKDQNG